MVFILLGPPGSGKGTQGRLLSERLGIPYLSSGDVLRDLSKKDNEMASEIKSYMEKGKLIPDTLMKEVFALSIKTALLKANGVILDGYPRTIYQANDLENFLQELSFSSNIIRVLELVVNPDELIERLGSRYVCPVCQRIYHWKNQKCFLNLKCEFCGSSLEKRSDDKEETIKERLKEYELKTRDLHEYYYRKGFLVSISGGGSISEVAKAIELAVKNWEANCLE